MSKLAQLSLHGRDDFRVQVTSIENGDAAGEIDKLATFYIGHGDVLGRVGKNRVNLTDAARYSGFAAFHQGFIGVFHAAPHGRQSTGF